MTKETQAAANLPTEPRGNAEETTGGGSPVPPGRLPLDKKRTVIPMPQVCVENPDGTRSPWRPEIVHYDEQGFHTVSDGERVPVDRKEK
jgi:hypothetical protein